MRVDLYLARKMRLGGKSRHQSADNEANSPAMMSMTIPTIGVALSIAIMLMTIAVIGGFRSEIHRLVTGFDAQITLTPYPATNYVDEYGNSVQSAAAIDFTPQLSSVIASALPAGATVEPVMVQPAILKIDGDYSAVAFRGYSDDHDWSFVADYLVDGSLDEFLTDDTSNSIVISATTASRLGLKVGDKINTCFLIDSKIRIRNFVVAAIYSTNFSDYDKTVAYSSPKVLRRLLDFSPEQCNLVEITGMDDADIDASTRALMRSLNDARLVGLIDDDFFIDNVHRSGAVYYNWLSLLDTNVVVIIVIMSLISVFTLIASLFIIILERVRTIAILKAIGATNSLVRRAFVLLASKIVIRGILWGNAIALALVFVQQKWRVMTLDPEAYFLSFVPVDITLWQVLLLDVAAILIALLVMILPSMVITRMSPARAVHYE